MLITLINQLKYMFRHNTFSIQLPIILIINHLIVYTYFAFYYRHVKYVYNYIN